ncbi:MAG TPA: hypothetical protein V6C93_22695 [Allocoleopsis sp.]
MRFVLLFSAIAFAGIGGDRYYPSQSDFCASVKLGNSSKEHC